MLAMSRGGTARMSRRVVTTRSSTIGVTDPRRRTPVAADGLCFRRSVSPPPDPWIRGPGPTLRDWLTRSPEMMVLRFRAVKCRGRSAGPCIQGGEFGLRQYGRRYVDRWTQEGSGNEVSGAAAYATA